jgi:aspartyl-tRNA(Asn)/glutamyl-tRNA(Gln) amidotransferase subunit A
VTGTRWPRPIAALRRDLDEGVATAEELLATAYAAQLAADDGPDPVHAFLCHDFTPRPDLPLPAGPLSGIPIAVKDNLCTADLPTTCGSRILEGYRSPFEATAVRRLKDAGGRIVGKTNMDEFAMGSSTEHSAYGPTRNPHDRTRVPGGSSGGSAAAVAAGIVPAALGSETGGSVRQPAAFCGVVGLKPTYGRVSRYGLVAFASSLDQVGIVARTVADAALVLSVVAGHDPRDSTSAMREAPAALTEAAPPSGLEGLVVGVPEEYFAAPLHPGVRSACRRALRRLEELGAELRDVRLPHTSAAVPAYHALANAEASSNLARFDGVRFGRRAGSARSLDEMYDRTRGLFGREVKRRILLGTWVLSAGAQDEVYASAVRARVRIRDDFRMVHASGVDLLFTPTTPAPAFRLGERLADPYEMYLADAFTVAANLAGVPALSLPIGMADGLPVGGQLIGPAWSEGLLLRTAATLEWALADEAGGDSSGQGRVATSPRDPT